VGVTGGGPFLEADAAWNLVKAPSKKGQVNRTRWGGAQWKPLQNLAPRLGVPGLPAFWGAFVDFAPSHKYTLPTDTIDLEAGPGAGQPSTAPPSSLERPRGIPM
jgi:hypothetical protein